MASTPKKSGSGRFTSYVVSGKSGRFQAVKDSAGADHPYSRIVERNGGWAVHGVAPSGKAQRSGKLIQTFTLPDGKKMRVMRKDAVERAVESVKKD